MRLVAQVKALANLLAGCLSRAFVQGRSLQSLRLRRFGSETNRAKHLHITKLGLGCPAAAFMVKLCMTAAQA